MTTGSFETNGDRSSARRAGAILAAQGLPAQDDYALGDSPGRFEDGGHFRLEISGVERLSTLEALIDEADRRELHIHRVVAFGAGATLLDRGELRAFAELAAERQIDVVACPGPRGGWDTGRQSLTDEGALAGRRVRGADNLRFLIDDYLRLFDCGLHGVLVWDEGVLDILAKARASAAIPPEARFKVSVYTGHANPAAIRILEELGADSLNPVGDLSRPMLAAIRSVVRIPLDIWAITFDSFGGMNRLWEAGEIAAVAAPCYFKIEPGNSESDMYTAWADPDFHARLVRHKVRHASILLELGAQTSPHIRPSSRPSPRPASITPAI
ncbi:MAG: hypothetical protein JO027_19270 [Solirubrobacterales bacterium]|nr:hypothetical protein [Solirubrobacterales bacterium]